MKGDQCNEAEPFWVARTHKIIRHRKRLSKIIVHWYTKGEGDAYMSTYKPCFILDTPTAWTDSNSICSIITTLRALSDGKLAQRRER